MEEEKKNNSRIEIFKYNAILSALFFLTSTLFLGSRIPNYDLSKYTISQMSFFLTDSQLPFFNLIFIIKCLLDLSFTYYVFKKYQLKLNTITSFIWLIAVLSFGLLGFFPVSKFQIIHWIITGCIFIFFTISEHVFAKLTKNEGFEYFSNNLIVTQFLLVVLFFSFSKINGIFEIVYFLLVFLWELIFISKFL